MKSFIIILVFIFLTMSCFGDVETINFGDVDKNGVVNIIDALFVAQMSVGLSVKVLDNCDVNCRYWIAFRADVNNDCNVSVVDALMIAQYSVGLLPNFVNKDHLCNSITIPYINSPIV